MKVAIGEVEMSPIGASTAGKERFKGEVLLSDGSKAFITLYRAATAKVAEPKAPVVRKAAKPEAPAATAANPAANPLADAGLSPEQLAKLVKVLAALKA